MQRWDRLQWVELVLRVLKRQKTSDGEDLTFEIEDSDFFAEALKKLVDHHEMQIAYHLKEHVFSAEKAELIRLANRRHYLTNLLMGARQSAKLSTLPSLRRCPSRFGHLDPDFREPADEPDRISL